jgi:hypothetical protein
MLKDGLGHRIVQLAGQPAALLLGGHLFRLSDVTLKLVVAAWSSAMRR